ncbi:MAG: hypothetical protein AB1758_04140 [Candidatus Eremiobacterota bacterium]
MPENLTYENFRDKKALLDHLAVEQGYLCPYTMIALERNSGLDAHIEHILPQSRSTTAARPGPDLDYRNMLACYPAKGDPGYGAARKGATALPLDPTDPTCETRLRYRMSGEVEPLDSDAESTISILNLNHRQLRDLRKAAIEARGLSPLSDDPATHQEVHSRMSSFTGAVNGRLQPFCVALLHAARVLLSRFQTVSGLTFRRRVTRVLISELCHRPFCRIG